MDRGVQHPNQYFDESRKALGFGATNAGDENAENGSASPVTPGAAGARPARPSIPRGRPCRRELRAAHAKKARFAFHPTSSVQ